jgi:transposase
MSKHRQVFSKEFKIEAVRLSQSSGKSDMQLARELGINRTSLKRWRDELAADQGAGSSDAFRGNGKRSEEAERIWKLEREVESLKRERELLKKVLAIVSQP